MRTDARVRVIVGLLMLAVIAVAIRVAAVLAVGSFRLDRVTYEHGEIARNLVEGRGFTERWLGAEGPTSQQAPVYPALLAVFYRLLGVESSAAKLGMQLFQAGCGGLLVIGVVLLARELLPDRPLVGWLSGAGAAVYPKLVYAATQIQVASLTTLLVVVVLWSAARTARLNSTSTAIGCGAASGLLILTDPILGLVVLVALIMLCGRLLAPLLCGGDRFAGFVLPEGASISQPRAKPWLPDSVRVEAAQVQNAPARVVGEDPSFALRACVGRENSGLLTRYTNREEVPVPARSQSVPMCRVKPARLAGIALLTCVATVTPWVVRNYAVHGELVPVKSTFGYAFWQGNHPLSFGTDKIPPTEAAGGPPHASTLDELERSLWQTRLHETRYIDDVVLSRDRVAELGRLSEPERSRQLLAESLAYIRVHPEHYARLCVQRLRYFLLFDETNPKSRVSVYRVSHLALLVVSLAGLWVSRHRADRLWPTYLVFGSITAFHALTIVSARFHIPVEPIQIIWGSCAIAWALDVVQRVGLRACASSHKNSTSNSLSSNDPILCP